VLIFSVFLRLVFPYAIIPFFGIIFDYLISDLILHHGELSILTHFEKQDIKGSYELRNFIAHNYEGIDFYIVEDVITERLPIILTHTKEILKQS
jgi:uncharacterized protein YutE (UPF0331/DUF86 family)